MRSGLRIGPGAAEADADTVVIVMIETADGLENVEAICATPGLDGVYVGPFDLTLGLGGAGLGDPAVQVDFDDALERITTAAETAGIAAGIHTLDGATAAQRLTEGFTFASVSADLTHLEEAAAAHLVRARRV
jgi:4-hydroxy-2-oxoheptanedioate aldolase